MSEGWSSCEVPPSSAASGRCLTTNHPMTVDPQVFLSLMRLWMRCYDIQFTPASLFHFVVIFFDFVQNSIEPRPVMSPTPNFDSFQPPKPNGSRGTGTPTFTPTMPALAFSIT